MQITMYQRSYPVATAPVALTFVRHGSHQRHTFTTEGKVYEAECRELHVVVPDGAKLDRDSHLLCWVGGKSTAHEVLDLAESRVSGFRVVK